MINDSSQLRNRLLKYDLYVNYRFILVFRPFPHNNVDLCIKRSRETREFSKYVKLYRCLFVCSQQQLNIDFVI